MPSEGAVETGKANGIYYVIQGDGPSVTLSHALGCDHTLWEPQVAALVDAGYRVLRFDTRGHGRSDVPRGPYSLEELAEDLLGVLHRVAAGPTHLVGLSLGGILAQTFALRYPRMLQSLVLCDTVSRYPAAAIPSWEERLRVAQAEGMAPLVEPTLARWFTRPFLDGQRERIAPIADGLRQTPVAGYVACAQAALAADLTRRLPRIEAASLVLVGEEDPVIALTREVQEGLPGSRLTVIPNASHLANVEQPERFNAALLGFLAGRRAETTR